MGESYPGDFGRPATRKNFSPVRTTGTRNGPGWVIACETKGSASDLPATFATPFSSEQAPGSGESVFAALPQRIALDRSKVALGRRLFREVPRGFQLQGYDLRQSPGRNGRRMLAEGYRRHGDARAEHDIGRQDSAVARARQNRSDFAYRS